MMDGQVFEHQSVDETEHPHGGAHAERHYDDQCAGEGGRAMEDAPGIAHVLPEAFDGRRHPHSTGVLARERRVAQRPTALAPRIVCRQPARFEILLPHGAVRLDFFRQVRFDPALLKQQDLDFIVRLQAAGARFMMLDTPQVIWNDRQEEERVSRARGHVEPAELLDRLKPLLSPNAVRGYRSTVLAYYLADRHPMRALRYIAEGFLLGGVSLRVTLRQLLRATLPRSSYRRIVDRFVSLFGRRS